MKKTSLFLMCAASVLLTACYSTKDAEIKRAQVREEYAIMYGCDPDDAYQHAGLRACTEMTAVRKGRKTVVLAKDHNCETIVVPKTKDTQDMLDPNRVYPVMDVRHKTEIVVEEGKATAEDIAKPVVEEPKPVVLPPEVKAPVPVVKPEAEPKAVPAPVVEVKPVPVVETPVQQDLKMPAPVVEEAGAVTIKIEPTLTDDATETTTETVKTTVKGESLEDVQKKVDELLNGKSVVPEKEVLPSEEK